MLLNQDMILTINILAILSEKPIPMVQIAKEVGTTYHYVHKITKKLNKKKWIASRSGPHGGIVCVPRFLTLRDVIELWESPYSLARQSNKVKGAAIVYEEWLIAAEQVRVRTFGG